ncbi:hypothetical protein [Methanosarcina horonobensis]|uniref:hypothetical protein n=1 Tax=Methanosarcina horonobensis TaxID=418008 RepID=UPI000A7D8B4C|nr:hypothetical protein [Methanosarcina horonobensis]
MGDMQTGPDDDEFIPGLDVCYFTTYTKFHPERRMPGYMVILLPTPLTGKMREKQYM